MIKNLTLLVVALAMFQLAMVQGHYYSLHDHSDYTVIYDHTNDTSRCNISHNLVNGSLDLKFAITNATNESVTAFPSLKLVNYAGEYPVNKIFAVQHAEKPIVHIIHDTSVSRTIRFNYDQLVGWSSTPCMQLVNYGLSCRFELFRPDINTTIDLFITIHDPKQSPWVQIQSVGYNNATRSPYVIRTSEIERMKVLRDQLNLTIDTSRALIQNRSTYITRDYETYAAVHMLVELRPFAFGFQCFDEYNRVVSDSFANWTGNDDIRRPEWNFDFPYAYLPMDSNVYSCRTTVMFTEVNNNHSVIPIEVSNRFTWKYSSSGEKSMSSNSSGSNFSSSNQSSFNESRFNHSSFNESSFNQSRFNQSSFDHSERLHHLEQKLKHANFVNKVLIGCVAVLGLAAIVFSRRM